MLRMRPLRTVPPRRAAVVAAYVAVCVIWGTTFLALRTAGRTMPPLLVGGLQYAVAGAALLVWLRWRRGAWRRAAAVRAAVVPGAVLFLWGHGCAVTGVQRVPSGIANVTAATIPLWVALIAWGRPGGTRPAGVALAGLVLGLAGVAWLVGPGLRGQQDVSTSGLVLLFLGARGWA